MNDSTKNTPDVNEDIAIIGMAGRFPGAANIDEFWANLRDGVEAIKPLSDEDLIAAGVSRSEMNDPDYVKANPLLEDVDKFDASFFGFSPRDASVMDPAHRIFLEIAWHAIEHAGYTGLPEEGAVGVFAGAGAPLYMIENVRTNPELMRSMGDFLVRHTGNDMNFLATCVSYEMDLRGPSMNVQTACSSALTSLHLACQSLRLGECSMALAGGSTVLFPHNQGYMYKEGEILSPDGHCRPFDAKSAGTVFGSGAGALVLKRLSDALDDGDTIHAVVKGSAVNNDGAVKVGYLAPGVDGQAEVITSDLEAANVSAESITYVETHGTGTLVGDPIEVEALNEAFGRVTNERGFCGIGSVKSNIGHLGEAAAAASLIKAVMALKHRQIPPSLGYETPNPAINFEDSPFYVNAKLQDWQSDEPLRCGVTALGAGGSNCHVILEEAPVALPGEGEREQHLLLLSGKSSAALDRASDNLADALEADPDLDLADAAYTLAIGRRAMSHRRAVVAENRLDAINRLRTRSNKLAVTDHSGDSAAKTVFMFPGGGAQYARMGVELYEQEDVYRDAVDECLAIINPRLNRDLKSLMFADEDQAETATRTLEQPSLTLPSLFTTAYALSCLYEAWGVVPDAYIGHSMGEYVAACRAGVVTLEEALELVMLRGELFEALEKGSMLSVPLSEADLRDLAPADVDIAAVNAPDLSVASGPVAAIKKLQDLMADRDVESTPIRIDVAAHSRMLDPILDRFRELCRTINFKAPEVPFVSNVTGDWITDAEVCDPDYWVSHLRSTVRFADGLDTLRSLGDPVLLEVGPGRTLSMLAKAQADPLRKSFNSVRHPQETASDLGYAMTSLGRLWAAGVDVEWTDFYGEQLRNRVPLPTYPFERQSFWVEPGQTADVASQDLIKREDISDWFYQLGFSEAPLVKTAGDGERKKWLIISETPTAAGALVKALAPDDVITACAGRDLSTGEGKAWRFNFDDSDQYFSLLQAAETRIGTIDHVVFIVPQDKLGAVDRARSGQVQINRSFLYPTYLIQALGGVSEPTQLSVLTTGLSGINGERVNPYHALALGPTLVTPRELEQLQTRCIDLPAANILGKQNANTMSRLVDELRAQTRDSVVALRPQGRWTRTLSAAPVEDMPSEDGSLDWVRENGVYLITGGLGALGLELAEHLARQKQVNLVLLAREGLPPESEWDEILASKTASRAAYRIKHVRTLRAIGANVLVVAGDMGNADSLRGALDTARAAYGPLNGVIHAAGVMDDAPLMSKTAGAMQRVLAPKVAGTVALDGLIKDELDIFVLFSSVASFLGLPGQIDYTAANAFLDAFARQRSAKKPGRTVVINWNAWRDIGMAANAHRHQIGILDPNMPCAHPALDGYTDIGAQRTYVRNFSAQDDWLLSEHVVKDGSALLPGTAFVELARAAIAEMHPEAALELTNLTFLSPFAVADGETKRLALQMTQSPQGGYEIEIHAGADQAGQPLVVCEADTFTGETPEQLDLDIIAHRCQVDHWRSPDGYLDQSFMDFGPRWANMKQVHYGHVEALIELKLDDAFASDIGAYGLHPAMLDMATGGVQALVPGIDLSTDFYVPLSYDGVRVFGEMPQHVFSHVTCLPDNGDGLAYFDVTLADPQGNVFVKIKRFTMRRLEPGAELTPVSTPQTRGSDESRNQAMDAVLHEAITLPEGLQAFDRIMSQPNLVQCIASSVDVQLWDRQLSQPSIASHTDGGESAGFSRPELAEDYAAPTSDVEIVLTNIWSELLGIRQVGILDDFFELGGNSLVGVRLFAAIRKKYAIALPLATLFEAPTVSDLANVLIDRGVEGEKAGGEPAAEWSPLVKINAGDTSLTPLFCVHGSRGNVVVFKRMADRLSHNRPVYGLQARGVDGMLAPDETIEAMANRYIEAIKTVQPHGPYMFAGNSGGGVISYEMAQILTARGEEVDVIMMIDSLEPTEIRTPISWFDRIKYLHKVQLYRFAKLPGVVWQYQIKPRLYKKLGREIIHRKLTPLEEAGETVHQAYHRAQAAYNMKPYDGDLLVIIAKDARMHFLRSGSHLGWQNYVSGKLSRSYVDAEHLTMFSEPAVTQMAVAFDELVPKTRVSKISGLAKRRDRG